jgi:hypothetical protein
VIKTEEDIEMITTLKSAGILLAVALSLPAAVSATTFDFAAVADGDASYGIAGGERGAASFTFVKDGISVTATGFSSTDPTQAYSAYLDSKLGNDEGGLGVCEVLTSGHQCNPSSDDNVTYLESLKLVFDQAVTIDLTTFVNGDHLTDFTGNFVLQIDGGAAMTLALTNLFTTPLTGTEFIFSNPNSGGGSNVSNNQQFYINAMSVQAVPVPAAVWLFASGLLGLVGVARRRQS